MRGLMRDAPATPDWTGADAGTPKTQRIEDMDARHTHAPSSDGEEGAEGADTPQWLREAAKVLDPEPRASRRLEDWVQQAMQLVIRLIVVFWSWFIWAVPAAARMPHPVEALVLRRGQGLWLLSEARQLSAASTQLTMLTLRAAPVIYSPEARLLLVQSAIVARRLLALLASPKGREACHALVLALSRALAVVGTEEASETARALAALATSASDVTAALAPAAALRPAEALAGNANGPNLSPSAAWMLEVYAEGEAESRGVLLVPPGATLAELRAQLAAELHLECDQLLLQRGGSKKSTPLHRSQEGHHAAAFFRSDADVLALRNARDASGGVTWLSSSQRESVENIDCRASPRAASWRQSVGASFRW